ncbi:hypothetical protein F751_2939 [Auxenochlorella protothecoides]|uniref:Uncharacterized protein n=1 Tax=Auxenochlorella protothecoides TaxID=3075 RepID=A0A087SAJ4_AUXPR|nr:hypothetical protein F751_2939 [Auxenochlorella protothecoides]KFM22748.1 hypothetical protein F751_2939 [Auxenochlorella protothecoides]
MWLQRRVCGRSIEPRRQSDASSATPLVPRDGPTAHGSPSCRGGASLQQDAFRWSPQRDAAGTLEDRDPAPPRLAVPCVPGALLYIAGPPPLLRPSSGSGAGSSPGSGWQ